MMYAKLILLAFQFEKFSILITDSVNWNKYIDVYIKCSNRKKIVQLDLFTNVGRTDPASKFIFWGYTTVAVEVKIGLPSTFQLKKRTMRFTASNAFCKSVMCIFKVSIFH